MLEQFSRRHLGPTIEDRAAMLSAMKVKDLDQLMSETVPSGIRIDGPLALPTAQTESEFLDHMRIICRI